MVQPLFRSRVRFVIASFVGLAVLAAFWIWAETDPDSLRIAADEDHWVENLTALLLLLSSVGFLVFTLRSRYLRERKSIWVYALPLAWVLLMFVFAGEEISWGQRIFGFGTPEWVEEGNLQGEFNLHNYGPLDVILGGKYRYLSIMMILTGLVIPLFARSSLGLRLIRRFAYPVCPLSYAVFFLGAYVFGKIWDPTIQNDAAEVRELIMSMGLFLFAVHGALRPYDLYLLPPPDSA